MSVMIGFEPMSLQVGTRAESANHYATRRRSNSYGVKYLVHIGRGTDGDVYSVMMALKYKINNRYALKVATISTMR